MITVQLLGLYLTSLMLEVGILIAMLHYLLNQLVDHSDSWEIVTYLQIMKAFVEYYLLWGPEDNRFLAMQAS